MTIKKRIAILLVGIILLCLGSCAAQADIKAAVQAPLKSQQGYACVAYSEGAFLAAGTQGRLDRISLDKQVENINIPTEEDLCGLLVHENNVLICGAGGTLLYSADGQEYVKGNTGVSYTLYDMAYFMGCYFACGDNGVILLSEDGVTWESMQAGTENSIISIASNDTCIMAVTAESEILISADGVNWNVENYNETNQGYDDAYLFSGIMAMGESFFLTGRLAENEDIPHIMTSETGEVWITKPIDEISGIDENKAFSLRINAIGYDLDQILAACDGGRILTLSDCYKCNKVETFANVDLRDLALGGDKLIIVGDGFVFDVLEATAARQYNIKAEQAYADLQNGAVMIDVRTQEEYDEGHIPGCIHIPVDEIEQRLPKEVPSPDTQIIFYCQAGVRAQTAMETALELGYQRVYNLGGISDWPYDIE